MTLEMIGNESPIFSSTSAPTPTLQSPYDELQIVDLIVRRRALAKMSLRLSRRRAFVSARISRPEQLQVEHSPSAACFMTG